MSSADPKLFATVFAILAGVFLSWILHAPWAQPNVYSDILSFWSRSWFAQGQAPYLADFFEYPPLAAGIVYFARIVGGSLLGYYDVMGVFSGLAAVAIGWSCWRIAKQTGNKLNTALLLMPSVIFYGVYNFDLFQVAFIMLSMQFVIEKRTSLSAIATALGVLTKEVNLVLLPIFLIELKGRRERIKYLVVTGVVLAVVHLPLAFLNFGNWSQVFVSERFGGLEDAWYVWIFQSTATWDYAKYFGAALGGLLLLRVYTLRISLVQKCFLGLAAYMLSTYVYTPQVNLILIPIVAVLGIEHPSYYLWEVFNVAIILTWFTWPNPVAAWSVPQAMALLRGVALVWLATKVIRTEMKLKDVFPREVLGLVGRLRPKRPIGLMNAQT